MALIRCPECGREISSRAKACPHCGFPLDEVIKPEEEKLIIEPVLERRKAFILTPIFIFIGLEFVFSICFSLSILAMSYRDEFFRSLMGLFIILMALFGAAMLIGVGGLVTTIVDRVKNNNRIDRNLVEYDNEKKILIFHSFKDTDISLTPDLVQHLDGNSKVFLYYKDMNKKGRVRMLTLGYASSNNIQKARNTILSLKSIVELQNKE